MRVEKTDLDDSVVEDGEASTILISDGKTLTTKIRDMPNKVHLPNNCKMGGKGQCQLENGVISAAPKQREPVEDCEEEEEGKEASGDSVLDSLTHSMKGVSIQETASSDLDKKLAELTVNDEEEDTRCTSLQSQSSIITVDPPSLPHEEGEEEKSEVAEDLAPRGPTAGKPASYRPNHDSFNHIAGKSYSTHNLDRFHPQAAATFMPPQSSPAAAAAPNGSYLPVEFGQNTYYPATTYGMGIGSGGKRGMDDEEETPFKYTRPVEEMCYEASQGRSVGDPNQASKVRGLFSQVSVDLSCGGNVVDTSLTPEEELVQSMKPAGSTNISYQPQLSITELDNMLQTFSQIEQASCTARDHDPGYSSENSPPSDNTGSPGSSPKSVFSPPPPSNMSQDSGIASPFSDDNLSTIVPSPPEESSSQKQGWMSGSQSAMYQSPPGGTVYHSPPSSTMYHSPPSMGGAGMSPPSVPPYQSPPSVTLYQNVASVSSAMSPPSMYQSPPSVTMYQSPASVASVMSPYSVAGSDDLSMTSAPSPITSPESQNDYIFNLRKEELRDALDVIAEDVKSMNERRKATQKYVAPVSSSMTPTPSNIPTSVTQQKSGRPEKLPIAPLPKQGRPGGPQQGSPVITGSVPVMVVPKTVAVAPATTASAPPITSCPVVVMNPGQNSMILLVNGNNQQTAAQTPKKKLQKILPRPGPPICDSAPKLPGGKALVKADLSSAPKQECSVSGNSGGSVVASGLNGVRPSPSVQPSPSPTPAPAPAGRRPAQGRNPPQSKMLNIARRLVASMTTPDLQFQDSEGDTYLHVSVCKADKNMVQALLERLTREELQGMINTQNHMRQTPLYLAVSANSPEMVSLLIQYGADVNIFAEHIRADGSTKEVKSALHCAASNGQRYLSTLQALLAARDLRIDDVNSEGHTALHCAILEHGKADSEGGIINNLPIIQILIKHGANPNAQGKKSGKTALMYALESRDLNLIEHVVAVIDPAHLRMYLKAQAFDGSTCQRIMENLQRTLDDSGRQRLHACFRISSKSTAL